MARTVEECASDTNFAPSLISICLFGVSSFVFTRWHRKSLLRHDRSLKRQLSSHVVIQHLAGREEWDSYCDDDEVFIQQFPKVELHVHLDGAFDPDFLWRYMETHPDSIYCLPVSVNPPWEPNRNFPIRSLVQGCRTIADYHKLCTCRGYRSLNEMLNCFEVFLPLVRGNLELIEQLAYDFCLRQKEQNVVYTEVRYSPHLLAESFNISKDDRAQQTSAESVINVITAGFRRGCQDFQPIIVNQILCAITWRPDWAQETVKLAKKYSNNFPCAVVGIDIAAGEEHFDISNHPDLHHPHLEMAKQANEWDIPLTLHAGEVASHVNVRRAIDEYKACRIGHGYSLTESDDTMALVRNRNVHVEICPTSSKETGGWTYEGDDPNWLRHPCRIMFHRGISISLNSDDPAVFHTSLAWQYRLAMVKMGFLPRDLIKMNYDAIGAAWCSNDEKAAIRKLICCYARQWNVLSHLQHHCTCEEQEHHMHSWNRSISSLDSFADRVYLNR